MKGSKDKSVVLSALGTQRTESSLLLGEGLLLFFSLQTFPQLLSQTCPPVLAAVQEVRGWLRHTLLSRDVSGMHSETVLLVSLGRQPDRVSLGKTGRKAKVFYNTTAVGFSWAARCAYPSVHLFFFLNVIVYPGLRRKIEIIFYYLEVKQCQI